MFFSFDLTPKVTDRSRILSGVGKCHRLKGIDSGSLSFLTVGKSPSSERQ